MNCALWYLYHKALLFRLFQRGCVFQVKFSKLHLNLTSGAQGFLYNDVTRDFEE